MAARLQQNILGQNPESYQLSKIILYFYQTRQNYPILLRNSAIILAQDSLVLLKVNG